MLKDALKTMQKKMERQYSELIEVRKELSKLKEKNFRMIMKNGEVSFDNISVKNDLDITWSDGNIDEESFGFTINGKNQLINNIK